MNRHLRRSASSNNTGSSPQDRLNNNKSNRSNNHHTKRNSYNNNDYDDMAFADLYTRPTESESYEDRDELRSTGSDSEQGLELPIPSGYLSPSSSSSKNGTRSPLAKGRSASASSLPTKRTGIRDEDRLLMMAKHPNATERQVVETLVRQQQVKALRDQQKAAQLQQAKTQSAPGTTQAQQQQQHQVTFSPAFPVDADTGEAWDRQSRGQRLSGASVDTSATSRTSHSSANTSALPDTSFDRAWAAGNTSGDEFVPPKQSILSKVWRRVFPFPLGRSVQEGDESIVSRQDASMAAASMTSDKTPKISNVDEQARAKRIRQQTGYLSWGDRWEHFQHKLFHTRQGLLVLALLLILIVAIVVTIITALASKSNNNDKQVSSNQAGQSSPQFSGGTLIPRPEEENFMTDISTFSPTSNPIPDAQTPPPSSSQSEEQQNGQIESGTSAPTPTRIPSNTASPTSRPSLRPTTPSPTFPDATRSPTRTPTLSPTQTPTLRATASPTSRPTTPQPTMAPIVPTPPPSLVSFLDSEPLTTIGASLVGSQSDQRFGQALSLSEDGTIVAVGAPSATVGSFAQAGQVQVFEWTDENGGSWQPRGFSLPGRNAGDQFGSAVALSADGSILVVSEPMYNGPAGDRSGNVRAFVYTGDSNGGGEYIPMGQEINGVAASDHFGLSLSISANGRRLAIGAPYHDNGGPSRNVSGEVTIYDYQPNDVPGGTWQPIATMAGTDHLDWFGWKVDLDEEGSIVCVGAPRNLAFGGYVQCHDLTTNELMAGTIRNAVSPLRYDDNFGHSLKVTSSGNAIRVAIGAPGKNNGALDAGMAVVYEYNASRNTWSMIGEPIAAESPRAKDELGFAIDLQGDILVLGLPGRGQVDRYGLISSSSTATDGSTTIQQQWERHPASLTEGGGATNDGESSSSFGYAVHQRGSRLAVGSAETPGENTGMVNVYG